MPRPLAVLLWLAQLVGPHPAALTAQPSLFDLLHARGDTVDLHLETDWPALLNAKLDKVYQPATLRTAGYPPFRARLRTRGNVRLRQCANPSLKIKLAKEALRRAGLAELNDLKLVVQCTDGASGPRYLARERLAYRLHAAVSPYHHRTVPVRLHLPDGRTPAAFLVESEEQLAARYNAIVIEPDKLSSRGLDRTSYLNACLFNYLLLNSDWFVYNRHNLECLHVRGTPRTIVIPYDFDYSGFVGTDYAVPHSSLGLRDIYEPHFAGRHIRARELAAAQSHFREREAALRAVITDSGLGRREIRRAERLLDDFYRRLGRLRPN